MPLLYYWREDNYRRDRTFGFGYHLNQASSVMCEVVPGNSLWAFTRRRTDGLYVLAAELIVRAITRNPPLYRYGPFRAWGDLERSRYFDIDVGPNAEPLIRALTIPTGGAVLGRAFQGHAAVRRLAEADHRLLARFAEDLPTLARVTVYPEDEFEARLVHGELDRDLVLREPLEELNRRRHYLYESLDPRRARGNVEELQRVYAGRCQVCLYDPQGTYGVRLCHGHHILWLSRGGDDELENMALLCPNHHAAVHRDDAPFDYGTLAFTFTNGRAEPLRLNRHLPLSA